MPNVRTMGKNYSCDKLLRQNRKRDDNLVKVCRELHKHGHGISAFDLAEKCNLHKSTVYRKLESLSYQGLAHNEHHFWYPGKTRRERESEDFELQKELIRAWAKIKAAELEALGSSERM